MFAGNATRIAASEPPLEPTPAKGSDIFEQPMVFARIHQYLSMATPLLWTRQPDTIGVLGLALNACEERNGQVSPDELDRIKELLTAASDLWRTFSDVDNLEEGRRVTRTTFRLIHLADIWAVTPGV